MKKLSIMIIAAAFLFGCSLGSDNEEKEVAEMENETEVIVDESDSNQERSTTGNPLFNDLLEPEAGNVYRGVHFNMKRSKVLGLEESRMTVDIYKDELPEELVITTDMGKEILDFADVTYSFDEQGLYAIKVETYNTSLEKATEVFDLIIDKYSEAYGEAEVAEDGYSEFFGTDPKSGLDFTIAVKNIDDVEESFGLYIFYDLM